MYESPDLEQELPQKQAQDLDDLIFQEEPWMESQR